MSSLSSARVKSLTLAACIIGSGIALLDGTVVNVALPTIQRHLGGGLAGQQWISNAYLLTLGSLILIGGSLGDIFGERRVFALGVGGFGAASLLCALSPTIGLLVACRALQGLCSGPMVPLSQTILLRTFPPAKRTFALALWGMTVLLAPIFGPVVGGYLIDAFSWEWIFLINLPIGLL